LEGEDNLRDLYLETMSSIASESIMQYNNLANSSSHLAVYQWFFSIYYGISSDIYKADIKYLPACSYVVLRNIQRAISKNATELFNGYIESCHDMVNLWIHEPIGKLQLYLSSRGLLKNEEMFQPLEQNRYKIYMDSELHDWLKQFIALIDSIKSLALDKKKNVEEIDKYSEKIMDSVIDRYKYNHLREMVMNIAAYCLFKERYEYIYYILTYKQPPDANATWAGLDIIPITPNGVIRFYLDSGFSYLDTYREGHRSLDIYKKKMIIFLLAYQMQHRKAQDAYSENLFDDYDANKKNSVRFYLEELARIADQMKSGNNDVDGMSRTVFLDDIFEDDLKNRVVSFLKRLSSDLETGIEVELRDRKIDPEKITEFKRLFIKSYNESAIFRNLPIECIDESNKDIVPDIPRLGINWIERKEPFFKNWHVRFIDWGTRHGKWLAESENILIFKDIYNKCKLVNESEIKFICSKFSEKDRPIILSSRVMAVRRFIDLPEFEPSWKTGRKSPYDLFKFEGWFKSRVNIPIYSTWALPAYEGIYILNLVNMGTLKQFNPLSERESKQNLVGYFYINVRAFSQEKELRDKYRDNPPPWLQEIERNEREDYLKARVLTHIFERFEFIIDKENFQGFRIDMDKEKL
jgi:hypothetical protein